MRCDRIGDIQKFCRPSVFDDGSWKNERTNAMLTIDAQVHAYERDHPARPWAAVLTGRAQVAGDDMVAAMDRVGVDGALLVSPFTMYRSDASYAIEARNKYPRRFALLNPVTPS